MSVTGVVDDGDAGLVVHVESTPGPAGCPHCGVVATAHGRDEVRLVDAPSFGRPVRLVWAKRRYVCRQALCPGGSFTEQNASVAPPRCMLTTRAVSWAVRELRGEHASISGLARRLGVDWHTVWNAVRAHLEVLEADPARFDGVTMLGVDEHVWHHVDPRTRGPRMLTGMVDLTRNQHGRTRARLLDLAPGRSGAVYGEWLTDRGQDFRDGVQIATLDPFHGYKNAIDDHLADATAVVDAFHVVKLATACVDDVRRRAGQDTNGLVHHSDRGAQYRAIRYTERLADAEAVASVGSKGDSYDNAMAEALNSLFKAELIRNKGPFTSIEDLEIAVAEYVDWFNHRRLHGEIGLVPPAEYEANHWASQPVEHYRQNPVLTEVGSN